jgi:hypothetical protein
MAEVTKKKEALYPERESLWYYGGGVQVMMMIILR